MKSPADILPLGEETPIARFLRNALARLFGRLRPSLPAKRVALLIDAENLFGMNPKNAVEFAKSRGTLVVSRAYADWASMQRTAAFKTSALKADIELAQATHYVKAKNTADILLVIDAMEIALSDEADLFVIGSHDSDFRALVHRLRKIGKDVILLSQDGKENNLSNGFCQSMTKVLPKGNDDGKVMENKNEKIIPAPNHPGRPQPKNRKTEARVILAEASLELFETGRIDPSSLSEQINLKDAKTREMFHGAYGTTKLLRIVHSTGDYEIIEDENGKKPTTIVPKDAGALRSLIRSNHRRPAK